jgi:Flp pilus assembly protein TadG
MRPLELQPRPRRLGDESGSVLILVALTMLVLLGFFALGVEAGRWYLIRAEISKSVDAGALAGAKNISNPHVDPRTIAQEFSDANFPAGYLATPTNGSGKPGFVAHLDGDKVSVAGVTVSKSVLAQLFGMPQVAIGTAGTAQMKNVEIMLVLDRSGSMAGQPIADLKVAARSFIDFFQATQADDRVGLVSFATAATLDRPMGSNFVTPIQNSINAMNAVGATNPADALAQAGGPSGFTDQSALPPDRRKPQFVIFFSDGRPTAFQGSFLYHNNTMNAVACVTGNCEPWDIGNGVVTYSQLCYPDREQWMPIDPRTTGDGRSPASACGNPNSMRWMTFDTEPVPGYAPTACSIPYRTALASHVCNLASGHALAQAQILKDRGITVYAIGLGQANPQFLNALATGPDQTYYAPTSDQLNAIFQKIAKEIKLRIVQ